MVLKLLVRIEEEEECWSEETGSEAVGNPEVVDEPPQREDWGCEDGDEAGEAEEQEEESEGRSDVPVPLSSPSPDGAVEQWPSKNESEKLKQWWCQFKTTDSWQLMEMQSVSVWLWWRVRGWVPGLCICR